ncbi:type IVB secretion system protein IcmH/DotU [Pseudomonas sp. GD03860]|uniref:type IVB secretion system protein IcmH/DotU n=1 Tax=Pseudomonas TaxID=286 RepID=UPI002363399D|nr:MULTISPECIES: type IVB secretion system protein IcmH/DotU [Pseudomonas]MDD2058587.1 type IVB secretion system protein IcmH/DotU [Pseudomonas putida]MDH0639548.1 type IVB secretion system protein IcmH/DotU [Pseudomonas sp. GD03860]
MKRGLHALFGRLGVLGHGTDTAPRGPLWLSRDGLCRHAGGLLYEAVKLREREQGPDLDALRGQLIVEVRAFNRRALEAGIEAVTVERAQYVICTLLDEVISSSEWGRGGWSKHSLLMNFHGQTFGGDGFFAYLDSAELYPQENLALLELMYLCLVLGLEGRYRIQHEGRAALALRRNQLYETLRQQHVYRSGPQQRSTSAGLRRVVHRWGAGALLMVLAVGLGFQLEARAYDTLQRLQSVELAQLTSLPQQLAERLSTDISSGRLSLQQEGAGVRMVIDSYGLFASGSSEVAEAYGPVLQRIARALALWPGSIEVIGHSDDTPVTGSLNSNLALSLARAEAVRGWLAADQADAQRFSAQGRGATEPLYANDSADNRAHNRRVEVLLYPAES